MVELRGYPWRCVSRLDAGLGRLTDRIFGPGSAGDWTEDGACGASSDATAVKVAYQSKVAPTNVGPKVAAVPNLSLSSALAAQTAPPSRRNSRFFRY